MTFLLFACVETPHSDDVPHPSKRTKEQHLFAAHIMRERKATMTSRRVNQQSKEQGADRFPATTNINMAYTQQTRTADVATTFDCDPSTVTKARAVVAHASSMSDNNLIDAVGKGVRAQSA